jgi:hypothetical protein
MLLIFFYGGCNLVLKTLVIDNKCANGCALNNSFTFKLLQYERT